MSFLDPSHEPLRRYIYTAATALVAIAVIVGFVTAEQAVAVTAFLGAVLLVPVVELARAKVDSPATVEAKVDAAYFADPLAE